MERLCATCLAAGRQLAAPKIPANTINTWFGVNIADPVCWECQATLLKFVSFRNKVIVAQHTLQNYEESPESLSELSYSIKNTYDDIIVQESIKTEGELYPESCDYISDGDAPTARFETNRNGTGETKMRKYCDTITLVSSIKDETITPAYTGVWIHGYSDINTNEDVKPIDISENSKNASVPNCETVPCSEDETVVLAGNRVWIGCSDKDTNEDHVSKQKADKFSNKSAEPHHKTVASLIEETIVSAYSSVGISNKHDTAPTKSLENISKKAANWETDESDKFEMIVSAQPSANVQLKTKENETDKVNSYSIVKQLTIEEVEQRRQHELKADGYVKSLFKCETCILVFSSKAKLESHKSRSHSENMCKICKICQQRFMNGKLLWRHHESHFKCYICRYCDFSRDNHISVINHYTKKHKRGDFRCDKCPPEEPDVVFPTHGKLHYHKRTMHREKFICQVAGCGKVVATSYSLKQHTLLHDDRGSVRRECSVCHKYLKGDKRLRKHMKVHTRRPREKVRDKVCEYCGKAFLEKKTLADHLNTHTGTRPYVCNVCGDTFSFAAARFTHKRLKHEKKA